MPYKWIKTNQTLRRLEDGACIPCDPANRDYADFLASGAVPQPEDVPPVLPNWQGFMADVLTIFTRARLRTIITAATFSAFSRGDAPAVKQDIDEMTAALQITAPERDAIYAKARSRNIPGF